MSSKMMANTYVYHDDVGYCVSTIDRESSAVMAAGSRYAETIVWDMSRNNILHMDSAPTLSLAAHLSVTARIYDEGAFWESEAPDA